eukprot:3653836-Prymnesium_polylepis.1
MKSTSRELLTLGGERDGVGGVGGIGGAGAICGPTFRVLNSRVTSVSASVSACISLVTGAPARVRAD